MNKVRLFYVLTGSMGAQLPARSLILSREVAADNIAVGQIIVFHDRINNRVTAHRIRQVQGDQYITKGDANDYQDRYLVTSADILGQVIVIIPVIDGFVFGVQVVVVLIAFVLGVLVRRFLLCLRHGLSRASTTSNPLP